MIDESSYLGSRGIRASEKSSKKMDSLLFKETDDDASYRRLLDELQRTFVHLDEGARGRVFDPKTHVLDA